MKPMVAAVRNKGRLRDDVAAGAEHRHYDMPDTHHSIRLMSPALTLLLASVALGACSGGDFGRTRADLVSDDVHRWFGTEATSSFGMGPAQFQVSDDERALSDLAYRL